MDELGLPRVKLLQISFCPVDGRMLGWAGLGLAGLGLAGLEWKIIMSKEVQREEMNDSTIANYNSSRSSPLPRLLSVSNRKLQSRRFLVENKLG